MRKALALLLFASPCAMAQQVEPGNWELTVTSQMQGLEKPIGPLSQTRCFSAEDIKDPGRVLGTGGSCQFSNRQGSDALYTFDVKCGGALPMSGTGRIRQSAHSFESDLELGIDAGAAGGGNLAMRTSITGKRLGPCKN